MKLLSNRRFQLALAVFVLATLAHLWFWWPQKPVLAWKTPVHPTVKSKVLKASFQHLGKGATLEPEDTLPMAGGGWLVACKDGAVRQLTKDGKVSLYVKTGGRPLGMAWGKDGVLYIADALKGLLQVSKAKAITTLVTSYNKKKLHFVDDVIVSKDNKTLYFSDASSRVGYYGNHRRDILSQHPTGSLFQYSLETKKVTLLKKGLYFANGIVLSPDESFILVNETGRYRTRRVWLKGKKAGTSDIFSRNYPGFPDNIRARKGGGYWVALISSRLGYVDKLMHPTPVLKKLLFTIPDLFWPAAQKVGLFAELDANGKLLNLWKLPAKHGFYHITSVREHEGKLLLGHIYRKQTGIGVLEWNKGKKKK